MTSGYEPERHALRDAIRRCHARTNPQWHVYGGRGIQVCAEWRGPDGYTRFLAHIGPKPTRKHTLDRIDNDRGYEPGNVRWATRGEQSRNTSRTRYVEIDGQRRCVKDWAIANGINPTVAHNRVARGWDPVAAVTRPATRSRA
jgi:hypothetical protein